jgi:hypothetical protein
MYAEPLPHERGNKSVRIVVDEGSKIRHIGYLFDEERVVCAPPSSIGLMTGKPGADHETPSDILDMVAHNFMRRLATFR